MSPERELLLGPINWFEVVKLGFASIAFIAVVGAVVMTWIISKELKK